MIRCAGRKNSSNARWFTTVRRGLTTKRQESKFSGSQRSEHVSAEKATLEEASLGGREGNGGIHDTPNGLLGGEQQSKPYNSRVLPISPLMDPVATAARQKHHMPKSPPSKEPSLFHQQLARNPYAQALATPVRMCLLTKIPLPNFFLQDFQIMAHPETREPWWVPTSLKKIHNIGKTAKATGGIDVEVATQPESGVAFGKGEDSKSKSLDVETAPPPEISTTLSPKSLKIGPGYYILSRQTLISAMQNVKSGWGPQPQHNFHSGAIARSKIAEKVRQNSFWRADMDTFILELMRRRIVEGLAYLGHRKRGYISGCVDWEDAKMASRQPAMILWTGRQDGHGTDGEGDVVTTPDSKDSDGPPSFATLTIGKDKPRMVPVHNLQVLLGSEHLAELRKLSPLWEKELLIVKHKRITSDIQMKFWKLQGYLAYPMPKFEIAFEKNWQLARRGLVSTHSSDLPDEDRPKG